MTCQSGRIVTDQRECLRVPASCLCSTPPSADDSPCVRAGHHLPVACRQPPVPAQASGALGGRTRIRTRWRQGCPSLRSRTKGSLHLGSRSDGAAATVGTGWKDGYSTSESTQSIFYCVSGLVWLAACSRGISLTTLASPSRWSARGALGWRMATAQQAARQEPRHTTAAGPVLAAVANVAFWLSGHRALRCVALQAARRKSL